MAEGLTTFGAELDRDYQSFLEGAIDFHVHAGPSVMPRRYDAGEVAASAQAVGMRGLILKDHYVPTHHLAEIVERSLEGDHRKEPLRVFGSVCLNAAVGGLNPAAVEVALLGGARVVYLPTVSAGFHDQKIGDSAHAKFMPTPPMKARGRINISDTVLSSDGFQEILGLVAEHNGVLATGHLSHKEIVEVAKFADSRGVRRMVLTHASLFEPISEETARSLDRVGAYFELTALPTIYPQFTMPAFAQPVEQVVALIERLDPNRVILSSDMGHPEGPTPAEALGRYLSALADAGVAEEAIRRMVAHNPAELLDLPG